VQNITGDIWESPTKKGPASKMTSVELPDLQHLAKFSSETSSLTRLSAPELLSAQGIMIYRPVAGSTVDLSKLKSVEDSLHLMGDFSR
jgi:hypothetical protein